MFSDTYLYVVGLILILVASLPDSNLFAKVTLFPNKQYLGMRTPTMPANTGPLCSPIRIYKQKLIMQVLVKNTYTNFCRRLQNKHFNKDILFQFLKAVNKLIYCEQWLPNDI